LARSFGAYQDVVDEAIRKSFLAACSPAGRDRVLDEGLLMDYPAGAIGYREYEPAMIGIVITGLVRAYLTSKDGRQITLKYGMPGQLFGTPALLGGPVPLCVQAIRDSKALVINTRLVEELSKMEPALGWRIAEEIGGEYCDLLITLSENVFDSVRVRTARHLLLLASPAEEGTCLRASITQRELADAVGSVREVISRSLHAFQREGVVEIRTEGIAILDPDRLKAIIRGA
jgi:CRP/FNR family cyclic AMP-dependent transcriptional regulator